MNRPDYAEKFRIMDREALLTLVAAAAIFGFFWLTIALSADSSIFILGMPLWFVLSCLGGYVLSVICVCLLVRRKFRSFDLD